MLTVAAARLEQEAANPKLIADLREAAKKEAERVADGRTWDADEKKRVERQRTLFTMLPVSAAVDRLKDAMMQHAYDLMWNGDTAGTDALLEFLPSKEADRVLDAWEADTMAVGELAARSKFYQGAAA